MKKTIFLFLTMLLFWGASASLNSLEQITATVSESSIPPTLEEIHLDILAGTTPPRPRSIATPPVSVWYNSTDQALIIDPQSHTGWLAVTVEDSMESIVLYQMVYGGAGCSIIDLMSLQEGYYKLIIQGEFTMAGWFEIY